MSVFPEKLVPIEAVRQEAAMKWLREPAARDFSDHLRAKLRWHMQQAAEKTLLTDDFPNMAQAATEDLREAARYKAAYGIVEAMFAAQEQFLTLK